jgi:predicted Zn-dependent protease
MILRHGRSAAAAAAVLLILGCALNPATGKRQLALVGEGSEIRLGQDGDREMAASLGLYEGQELAPYVTTLGKQLAAYSERPHLPWTFRIADDPMVNAFALPGGIVYVTRGLMAHCATEAELAAVLGHEIGHVTARHSVNQMSKAQIATLGLGIGILVEEDIARHAEWAGLGLSVLFLRFSRDDERQADELGLRYLHAAGYAPGAMTGVLTMLDGVGKASGEESRAPSWLSTHPSPEDRLSRIEGQIATSFPEAGGREGREEYLRRLNGMVFGEDPRQGFFRGSEFIHPDLAFRFPFPEGWKGVNRPDRVLATSPERDALVEIHLSDAGSPQEAAERFFAEAGMARGAAWRQRIGTLPVASYRFTAPAEQPPIEGIVVFLAHQERVFSLAGYAAATSWARLQPAISAALAGFAPLVDPALLTIQPRRLEILPAGTTGTLAGFDRRHPSTIPIEQLALINRVDPEARLAPDRLIKRVTGGP